MLSSSKAFKGLEDEACKLVLENLCMNDPYIYSAIRGTLRTILTAPIDGDLFQSALWLCGPPGSSKSVIADLFKRFVPKETIAEFAHTTNQFTGSSLANKRLIIFSDTVGLSQAQFQMVKPLLGRDALRNERKFLNEVTSVSSKAAIIFVSNFHPSEIPHIKADEAVLEKLIVVQFPAEAAIPPQLQMPKFVDYMDKFIPKIFNWAMFTPPSVLRNHIRAAAYNNILRSRQDPASVGGLSGYIMEYCVYSSDPDDVIFINDIKQSIKEDSEKTGDDYLRTLVTETRYKESNAQLGSSIVTTIKNVFNRSVTYQRYTRRDKGVTRPMVIKNMAWKPKDGIPLPETHEPFEFKFGNLKTQLDEPFYAEQRICWLKTALSQSDYLYQNQKELKEYRESLFKQSKEKADKFTSSKAFKGLEESSNLVFGLEENLPLQAPSIKEDVNGLPPLLQNL
uniref:Putative plasmid-associated DNA primase n=1 Tax=Colemanosphaera angeleri TaxID=1454018 RepID=A0A6C0RXH3_9CHLO|nr:putative plasmid-associated DNA primase [Colemanosphaera angeleri]QIA47176.1 putative plasmid-associated DNA primase [Colemanosphaera angeleri]